MELDVRVERRTGLLAQPCVDMRRQLGVFGNVLLERGEARCGLVH